MAGKPKRMSQIKQLLRLHKRGKSKRFIARTLGMSRNTVKSYLNKLSFIQLDINDLLALQNPVLEKQFYSVSPAYKERRYRHLKGRLDFYTKQLEGVSVNRQTLWEEYQADCPGGYKRSQFFHHLAQHK